MNNVNTISTCIGRNYLPDWGIQEALREVYQNFLDFGIFTEKQLIKGSKTLLILSNSYNPNDLGFLKIGETNKLETESTRGKHGEGLKMALLIFLRNNCNVHILTGNKIIYPCFFEDSLIGEVFNINIVTTKKSVQRFTIKISVDTNTLIDFKDKVVTKEDIIFKHYFHGSIVNKDKGNIYSGGLYICNIPNMTKAYDIPPERLSLDRDRKIPPAFETSYHTSKINEEYSRSTFVDKNYSDSKFNYKELDSVDNSYRDSLPKETFKDIRPVQVGNNIEFVAKQDGEEVLIKNTRIIESLKKESYFSKAVSSLKKLILSKLGVTELLIQFRKKHCITEEAKEAFDVILQKLNLNIN